MKNATKHADVLKSVCKKLVREHKPAPKPSLEPLPALVRGAMSYDVPDSRADEAIKLIEKEFVDLNELRVATDLEIQELLGQRYPKIEERVAMITVALNNIFERLKTISKRDARQFLRELPDVHPFVEAYVMLHAFDAPAFPIDDDMLEYLIEEDTLEEGTGLQDAQKFVEHHLKGDELYDFYASLRSACHNSPKRKKKR
jgi:endonuclease III